MDTRILTTNFLFLGISVVFILFPQICIKIIKIGITKSKGINIMVILYFTECFLQPRQASGYTIEQDKILVFIELTVFSGEYRLRGKQPETVKKIPDSDSITTETECCFRVPGEVWGR